MESLGDQQEAGHSRKGREHRSGGEKEVAGIFPDKLGSNGKLTAHESTIAIARDCASERPSRTCAETRAWTMA